MDNLIQRTLVIIKPDGMKKNLAGEIIRRIEAIGLKMVEARLVRADRELATAHYPVTEEWLSGVGGKSLTDYEKYDLDPVEFMGTNDPIEIGKMIHKFNIEYLMSGPVLAMVFEGLHAVETVRKLSGATIPMFAPAGTIRGDLALDSAIYANSQKRSVENLMHASGTPEEAEEEIKLWFGEK